MEIHNKQQEECHEDANSRYWSREWSGPPIWAAVSSPMFDIMHQGRFYALVTGEIPLQQRHITGFVFINNMDLCITHKSNYILHVIVQMQQVVTHWEGLLRATVGALVSEKCFWYLVDFENTNNKWKYKTINKSPSKLQLLDSSRKTVTIQWLEPS